MKLPHPLRAIRKAGSSIKDIRARHSARKRSSGMGFLLADSVDFLDAQRWDELTRHSSVWMRRDVLRVIEHSGPENVTPRYAMIFRDGVAVAALAAQIVHVTGDRFALDPDAKTKSAESKDRKSLVKKLLKPAKHLATKKLNQRLLVAGNLLCWGFHGITMHPEIEPEELWSGIGEALYRMRRAERLTGQTNLVMVKDFTPLQSGMDSLHRLSYRPLETEPDMVLSIAESWKTYDDYLAALESKYRSNAKSQMKKLAAGNVVIERLHDLSPHAGRLHELYKDVQKNAAVKLVTVPESYHCELSEALGDSFRCHVARREGEILGFVTTVKDGDTTIAYYIGFDREAASGGLPIYLRLLHATISDAIDWGTSRLSLGRTALEPKAAMGAKPEPLSVWLRHRVPVMNWMVRGLLNTVSHEEPPDRNPFKSTV